MKFLSKNFLILFLGIITNHGMTCEKKEVISEISKFHGPEWSSFISNSNCTNSQIKSHLKAIITSPSTELSQYDQGLRQFLFRNAIKSYGHFGPTNEDLNYISKIYNDESGHLKKLFGENVNLFRPTILESLANTGNIEALDFYQKILENDKNVLYLQKAAADFAFWILEGSPFDENQQLGGSRQFAEMYFPNLKHNAETRLQGNDQALDALREKKASLALLLQDMINRKDHFKEIMPSLEKLLASIENKNTRSPQSINNNFNQGNNDSNQDSDGGGQSVLNSTKKLSSNINNTKRSPANDSETLNEESENNNSIYFYLKIFIFITIAFLVFYFSKKSKWQK